MSKTDREYETDYAVHTARETLAGLREHFERMARDIADYEERFAGAENASQQVQRLSSVVHHVSCNNNPRLDLVANAMAEIMKVAAKYRD